MYWLCGIARFSVLAVVLAGVSGCSSGVNFNERKANVTPKPNEVPPPPPPKTRYEYRNLNIPTDSEEFRPQIKVGLVLDNSRSMSDEQAALSEGFLQLLQSFRSDRMNLSFLIFTTSQEGNKRATEDFSEYRYIDANGQQVVTTDPAILQQQIPGLVHRSGQRLTAPQTAIGSPEPLEIRTDMNEAEFDAAVTRIRSVIQNVGISGSDDERGLCTLGRMLAEDSSSRKIFNPQDLSALMIVSDSNDADSENNCRSFTDVTYGLPNNYTPWQATSCRPGSSNCTQPLATKWQYVVAYFANQDDWAQVWYYPVACVVDGQRREPCTDPNFMSFFWVPINQLPSGTPPASSNAAAACTPNMINWINSTNSREDVRASGPGGARPCNYFFYKSQQNRYYTDGLNNSNHLDVNLCNPPSPVTLTVGSTTRTVNNLGEFFQSELPQHSFAQCFHMYNPAWDWGVGSGPDVGGRYQPTYGQNSSSLTTVKNKIDNSLLADFPSPSANLKEAIFRKANKTFGSSGYIASMIVDSKELNDRAQEEGFELSCGGPPEGEGLKYLELAQLIGEKAKSFPICLADYAPALEPLRSFIQTIVHTVYSFSLESNEEVIEVKLSRAGTIIPVGSSQYEIVGSQIRFDDQSIQPGDQIILRIKKTVR